mgnify:CR=1 FL=1
MIAQTRELPKRLLAVLEADGVLRSTGTVRRTTKRWQAAMMRAVILRMATGKDGEDLRIPITLALLDLYGERFSVD